MTTYRQGLGTPIRCHASSGKASKDILTLFSVLYYVLGGRDIGILEDEKDKRHNGHQCGIHDKPVGSYEKISAAHFASNMDDVPRDAHASCSTSVCALVVGNSTGRV